jgi:hypothetical protein
MTIYLQVFNKFELVGQSILKQIIIINFLFYLNMHDTTISGKTSQFVW